MTIRAMNTVHIASAGRIRGIPRALGYLLAILALSADSAEAQPLTRRVITLQASADQLKKDIDQLKQTQNEQSANLNKQLVDLREELKQKTVAPPEAWRALALIGSVFAIAWGVVSLRRESIRGKELDAERSQRDAVSSAEEAMRIDQAVDARIKLLIGLLREAQK